MQRWMPLLTASGADMKNNGKNNNKSVTEGAEKRASSFTISGSTKVDGLSGGPWSTMYEIKA